MSIISILAAYGSDMSEHGHPTPLDDAGLEDVRARAYVPEHVPSLMSLLSSGEAYLLDDHLVLVGEHGVILVGYPLDDDFSAKRIDAVVAAARAAWRPEQLAYIGPALPPALARDARDVVEDVYFVRDVEAPIPPRLDRIATRAAASLEVRETHGFQAEHERLIDAFRAKASLPPAVDRLYASMPAYVAGSETAAVLSAWGPEERLQALFVVERGAKAFDAYLLGCRAPDAPVAHASDLLMRTLIARARAAGKAHVDLGLGVNEGIRRFKEKWGGRRGRPYVSCEVALRRPSPFALLRHLWGTGS